jgi:hypothetical protein
VVELREDLRLALDRVAFARSLGLEPDPWQLDVLNSDARNLILCCSRQSGKSTVGALLALHKALMSPGSLVIVCSPGERQSKELYQKVARFYRHLGYPVAAESDRRTGMELTNGSRIEALPAVERTTRGYAADLLIADEAAGIPDEDYYGILPMLIVTRGRQLLMSTPRGKRGFFHDIWHEADVGWEKYMVTADQVPRIGGEDLEAYRRGMPEYGFRQEFYCEFLETEDSVFTYDMIMGAVTSDVTPLDIEEPAWQD